MYALVEIKGKQYKAEKDALLKVDHLEGEQGAKLEFDTVLMTSGKEVTIGTPYVKEAKIKATIEDHGKDKKILVTKYKRRKGYHRRQGHRQQYTLLRVKSIIGIK